MGEPQRDARPDLSAGFEPPASLTAAPELLPRELELLVGDPEPHEGPRTPPRVPWPDDMSLDPPTPPRTIETRPCRSAHYLPHEARPLLTVEYEYDAQGRVIEERVDEDTDGTIDETRRHRWAPDGQLAAQEVLHAEQPDCEGMLPAFVARTEALYDRHGVWLESSHRVDDGTDINRSHRRTQYDERDRPSFFGMHDGQGGFVLATTLRWDEHDRRVEQVWFQGREPLSVSRWLHPSPRERYQATWSGEQWTVHRERLDARGEVVQVQTDDDEDGVVDRFEVIERDAEGRQLRRRIDDDADGEVEIEIETRWKGEHELAEVERGPEGQVVKRRWTYDEQGRLLRASSKIEGHWAEDLEVHRYDEAGRELEYQKEEHRSVQSANDLSNYVERDHHTWEYDAQGRLVGETMLVGALGPNERVEYSHDCTQPYQRHPNRDPLLHPETAAECQEDFE